MLSIQSVPYPSITDLNKNIENDYAIELATDSTHTPIAMINGHQYTSPDELISLNLNAPFMAIITNWLINGASCSLIIHPNSFKTHFKATHQLSDRTLSPARACESCNADFCLDEIDEPKFIDGVLTFYLIKENDGMPYRVTLDPTTRETKMETLPYNS